MSQARTPSVVVAYCTSVGLHIRATRLGAFDPTIDSIFRPGSKGWTKYSGRKRINPTWCRKLRAKGVTHVGVQIAPGRVADFDIKELVKR